MAGNYSNEPFLVFSDLIAALQKQSTQKYLKATFQEGTSWPEALINTGKYNMQPVITLCLTVYRGHLFSHE